MGYNWAYPTPAQEAEMLGGIYSADGESDLSTRIKVGDLAPFCTGLCASTDLYELAEFEVSAWKAARAGEGDIDRKIVRKEIRRLQNKGNLREESKRGGGWKGHRKYQAHGRCTAPTNSKSRTPDTYTKTVYIW